MKIKPLGSRILVQIKEGEEKTSGGLYIPATAQEKTNTGIVVALGDKDVTVKEGQEVIFDKYAGTQIRLDDKDHLLLDMDNVLAVIE
ncbi:chaperonin GroES [Brevinema andersonii]|uniref:Co-chaperonin GroES n=1 Tax=Brevinema andersonii TaxID=34097 RepID=A0A1I1E1W0_BREAD|nr:co-chaperone GroES [Brevinema andersonii]SFB81185.1 chaperonin GroES [Brevinema andersonii]